VSVTLSNQFAGLSLQQPIVVENPTRYESRSEAVQIAGPPARNTYRYWVLVCEGGTYGENAY
jgi:hypothetical protein